MPNGKCAGCGKTAHVTRKACAYCDKSHNFCGSCGKEREGKKIASLLCKVNANKISRQGAVKVLAKAKEADKRQTKVKKAIQDCKAKAAYTPPANAVVDKSQLGPSDEADIANNPLRYVHIRANEIWKTDTIVFGQTTACVSIVECGATKERKVILTSCVEGATPHAPLKRAGKATEICPDPDPIVYRVRRTKEEKAELKEQGKKADDMKFVARKSSTNPEVPAGVRGLEGYDTAQRLLSARVPPYTVTSGYPGDDVNETHAEQRAIAWAAANGCTVIAQAPTIGCCDECRADLTEEGLAKVPEQRRSAKTYNAYKNQVLLPSLHDKG